MSPGIVQEGLFFLFLPLESAKKLLCASQWRETKTRWEKGNFASIVSMYAEQCLAMCAKATNFRANKIN